MRLERRGVAAPTSTFGAGMWVAVGVVYLFLFTVGMTEFSYDTWSALVLVPVLGIITVRLMARTIRKDDPGMVRLIAFAFAAKIVGTFARYAFTSSAYERSDSDAYHEAGSILARAFWEGNFADAYDQHVNSLVGTPFMRLVTGFIYIVTGPTKLGGFVIFSVLSFWGLFWFYRAVRVALPEADHRRYALLLFFLPSILYWPSSTGKEAWMLATVGLATYGVALILRHNPLGYPYAGFGLVGTAMVRPHMTALVGAGLVIAFFLRRNSRKATISGPFGKWIGLAVMLLAGGVVMGQVASFFNLEEVNSQSVDSVFNETGRRSGQGGSEYDAVVPTSPTQYPTAVMTVLFRPFPWEAHNLQAISSAAEGMFLAALCVVSYQRVLRVPRMLFKVPFVAYCLAYSAMFIFAWSAIGNFGIISRQRTQLFPLFLVLLCLPRPKVEEDDDDFDFDELPPEQKYHRSILYR